MTIYKTGSPVYWADPAGETSGVYTVAEDKGGEVVTLRNDTGSEVEAERHELRDVNAELHAYVKAAATLFEIPPSRPRPPRQYADTEYSRGIAEAGARLFPAPGVPTDIRAAEIWGQVLAELEGRA